jgi:RNA polymerase sigma-70 factor (ECF subfamily)
MAKSPNNNDSSRDAQFLRLLMGNQDKIYAFILSLVHNSSDAEDILQDVTTVMWRKYDTFKPGTSFIGWGITIARLQVLKFFEKNRHSKLSFSPDLEQQLASMTQEKVSSTKADILRILKQCLRKLDTRNYELIKLRYVEKKPTKEIANERGIPPHTMYRMIGKIHKILHRCIQQTLTQESI